MALSYVIGASNETTRAAIELDKARNKLATVLQHSNQPWSDLDERTVKKLQRAMKEIVGFQEKLKVSGRDVGDVKLNLNDVLKDLR